MLIDEGCWQPTGFPGIDQIPLTAFEHGGKTLLMRLAPSIQTNPHAHESQSEEIYVLEGSFSDDEREYKKGDYCLRLPGQRHRAWSKAGCIALVIYR